MISERISDDIPPRMKILNMGIPILMNFCRSASNLERCKPHKAVHQQTICDVINGVKLFPTVYHRIYCRKVLTLSNQTSRNKTKCIRIVHCLQNVLVQPCRKPILRSFLTILQPFYNLLYAWTAVFVLPINSTLNMFLHALPANMRKKVNYLLQIQNISETA